MSLYLQPALPWVGSPEEERRFRQVLTATVLSFLLLALIIPYMELPQIEQEETPEPPRFARIITETIPRPTGSDARPRRAPPQASKPEARSPARTESGAPAAPSRPSSSTVAVAPPPETVTATAPQPSKQPLLTDKPVVEKEPSLAPEPSTKQLSSAKKKPSVPARAVARTNAVPSGPSGTAGEGNERVTSPQQPDQSRVSHYGVLALSDSLAELRHSAPTIAPDREGGAVQGGGELAATEPQRLVSGVTRGSGGLSGDGPSLKQLTGASVPGDEAISGTGPGLITGTGGSPLATAGMLRKARSEDEIQEILNRNKRAIYRIYNRELRKNPSLRGKVVVSITIAPAGQVTRSRVVYSELKAESLEQKLILLIKRIDFGSKPGVPTVTTKVPIEFFPV